MIIFWNQGCFPFSQNFWSVCVLSKTLHDGAMAMQEDNKVEREINGHFGKGGVHVHLFVLENLSAPRIPSAFQPV